MHVNIVLWSYASVFRRGYGETLTPTVSPRSKAQERSQRKKLNLAEFLLPL